MRIIARYLPQFHRIPENDKWWGEGYTEWIAVKNAKQLYEGQNQPRAPKNENYYDLSNVETIKWQAELAQKNGVSGFAFYHYWFSSEKRVMEGPVELLRQNKDIDIGFCFTWANESWARSWSNIVKKNTWNESEVFEDRVYKSESILIHQKYGGKEEWEKHIEYLIPFFQDERYIRYNDRPVFIIYSAEDIMCLDEMVEYWNEQLCKVGIKPLYIISESRNGITGCEVSEADLIRFPTYAVNRIKGKNTVSGTVSYDYNEVWDYTINTVSYNPSNKKRYVCAAVDYDDTPRRGKNGYYLNNVNPGVFKTKFEEFIIKNAEVGNEFVFINAWNEWGEGMYLEPDERWDDLYLQAIREVSQQYCDCYEQQKENDTYEKKEYDYLRSEFIREQIVSTTYKNWLMLSIRGISIYKELWKSGIKSFAIYGASEFGRLLFENSEKKDCVAYFIDRNSNVAVKGKRVYSPLDSLPQVDAVIIALVGRDDSIIRRNLKNKWENEPIIIGLDCLLAKMIEECGV